MGEVEVVLVEMNAGVKVGLKLGCKVLGQIASEAANISGLPSEITPIQTEMLLFGIRR